MLLGNRRSDLEVVADILRSSGSKTDIMYGAKLSHAQTRQYLALLLERDFLELVTLGNKRQHYRPTAKGRKLLQLIEALEDLVYGDSLPPPYPQVRPLDSLAPARSRGVA